MAPIKTPTANWKIVDSKTGVIKQGTFTAADVCDPTYTRPSQIPPNLTEKIAKAPKRTSKVGKKIN
jgi:hypothetical protein